MPQDRPSIEEQRNRPLTIKELEDKIKEVYLIHDTGIIKMILATIIGNRLGLSDQPIWLLLIAGSGGGKCFKGDTKILMYDGSIKNAKDVKKGDILMGDDSKPRNVLSTTSGFDTMYKIHQSNASDYIVNSPHILSLKYNSTEKKYKNIKKGDVVDIDLPTYLKKNNTFKNKFKGYKVGVEFKEQPTSIDPYYLGIWLGDGESCSTGIFKYDKEIGKFVRKYAKQLGMKYATPFQGEGQCTKHCIVRTLGTSKSNILHSFLKNYNLLNTREKFVPTEYKINSRQVRLQILAGLLDTDGSYDKRKHSFEFSNKSKKLADDVVFLAQSLGFYASINPTIKTIKSIGFSGKYWRVYISGDLHLIPTKIKRKQAPKHTRTTDVLCSSIKVRKLNRDKYYGFEIDGNRRFLLSDFTVVHNTMVIDLISKCGPWIVPVDTLTTNTFASGLNLNKETSLLHKASNGILVFKDFTGIMNLNEEGLKDIMGQLRNIFDGSFTKRTGNGNDVEWKGKIGVIAGGTIASQRKMRQFSEQGERMINYIINLADSKMIAKRALGNRKGSKDRAEDLADMVAKFVNQKIDAGEKFNLKISNEMEDEMIDVADFATRARSPVTMDKKDPSVVLFVGDREIPTRVAIMLTNIAFALMIICDENELSNENANIIFKTALDSIPVERRIVLSVLAKYRSATTKAIAMSLHYPTTTVRAWLSQLNALRMITREASEGKGSGNSDSWELRDEYKTVMIKYENIEAVDAVLTEPEGEYDELPSAYVADDMVNQDAEFLKKQREKLKSSLDDAWSDAPEQQSF